MQIYYSLLLDEPFDPARPAVESKREMARALCARLHGEEAARGAEEHFNRLHVEHRAPDEVEELEFSASDDIVHLPGLIAKAFDMSRSEARRLIEQGGVRVNGEPVRDGELDLSAERLDGALLQVGRRRFRRLRRV
jgi:tyrosyl-tRNA synthetase